MISACLGFPAMADVNPVGFPGGSAVKNPPAQPEMQVQARVGNIPWSRKWQPTPIFLPEKFHEQKSLADYSPQCRKESDTAEHAGMAQVIGSSVGTVSLLRLCGPLAYIFSDMGNTPPFSANLSMLLSFPHIPSAQLVQLLFCAQSCPTQ